MDKIVGLIVLIFLAPWVLTVLVTPLPDEWAAIALIAPFAGWLLASFNGKG